MLPPPMPTTEDSAPIPAPAPVRPTPRGTMASPSAAGVRESSNWVPAIAQ